MLTASSLSDETKLYGTKVGVLHNSEEYRLGVKRNAETKGIENRCNFQFLRIVHVLYCLLSACYSLLIIQFDSSGFMLS